MAGLLLKKFPDDVRDIILKKQLELKLEKSVSQFSMELTMYSIIREWKSLNLKSKK
jgi:hypothetical protein